MAVGGWVEVGPAGWVKERSAAPVCRRTIITRRRRGWKPAPRRSGLGGRKPLLWRSARIKGMDEIIITYHRQSPWQIAAVIIGVVLIFGFLWSIWRKR